MIKIYTGAGDKGQTYNPLTKSMEYKHGKFFRVVGSFDELQSWLGFLRSRIKEEEIKDTLKRIQIEISNLNSHLSTKGSKDISEGMVKELEREIDRLWGICGDISGFILPSGSENSTIAHIARSVCRRAERELIGFYQENNWVSDRILMFVNRLSDYLFALARYLNRQEGFKEEVI